MIKGIGHAAYNVQDMKKSLHFYNECLGFKKLFEIEDDKGKPWIVYLKVADGQFIELFYDGKKGLAVDTRTDMGYNHLCLEVDDIYETAKLLKDKGIVLDVEPKQGKDLNYQCWAKDPDGNRIEFMQMSLDAPQKKY